MSSFNNPILTEVRTGQMPLNVALVFLSGTYADREWDHATPGELYTARLVLRRLAALDPEPWLMRRHDRHPNPAPRSAFPDFAGEPEWEDRDNSADYAPRLPRDIREGVFA